MVVDKYIHTSRLYTAHKGCVIIYLGGNRIGSGIGSA